MAGTVVLAALFVGALGAISGGGGATPAVAETPWAVTATPADGGSPDGAATDAGGDRWHRQRLRWSRSHEAWAWWARRRSSSTGRRVVRVPGTGSTTTTALTASTVTTTATDGATTTVTTSPAPTSTSAPASTTEPELPETSVSTVPPTPPVGGGGSGGGSGGGEGAGVFRLTNGSGRSTDFDNSDPPGIVSHHGTRIYCVVSHFSHDDPIVYPGQPGAAHAHMFWGNTGSDAASSGPSLLAGGNSSCEGGTTNRSSYWAPALFNAGGEVVIPETIFVYYKSFGGPNFDRSTIRPIPAGLQMLASRNVAHASDGHFRVGASDGGTGLDIRFPECVAVDGSGSPILSSADNVSHLSYASGSGPSGCPASHPYRIPQVSYILRFDVPFSSAWSLASDHAGGAKGASLHADYIAAWDPATMDEVVECVVSARGNCGFAGGRGQLPERFAGPDGTVRYANSVSPVPGADRTPFGTAIAKMVS